MEAFEEHLEVENVPDSYVDKFEALTEEQQAQFVAVLTSGDLDQPGVETTESTETVVEPAGKGLVRSTGTTRNQTLNFTIYNVTSTYSVDSVLFGISLGYWKQVYKYQTGNNIVQASLQCTGTWTGFSRLLVDQLVDQPLQGRQLRLLHDDLHRVRRLQGLGRADQQGDAPEGEWARARPGLSEEHLRRPR